MALTPDEQAVFDAAVAAMPSWYTDDERQREDLAMFAKVIGRSLTEAKALIAKTVIGGWPGDPRPSAPGPVYSGQTLVEPDWLNQHARDRDTSRALGETNVSLRARIRNVVDVVTRKSLLAAVAEILTAENLLTTGLDMIELPRDGAFFGEHGTPSGTGGTFAKSGNTITFTPTVRFSLPPYHRSTAAMGDPELTGGEIKTKSGEIKAFQVVITGAADAGNDGTFDPTGLAGNGVTWTNAAGVAGADAGVSWTIKRLDAFDVDLNGAAMAFFGDPTTAAPTYLMAEDQPPTIIAQIPHIPDVIQRARVRFAAEEVLRQLAGGGVVSIVQTKDS
jgi:hypothetical protein